MKALIGDAMLIQKPSRARRQILQQAVLQLKTAFVRRVVRPAAIMIAAQVRANAG